MRITFVIISIQVCCTALLLASTTHAQNITVDVKNTPVKKVLTNIETQAGVSFVCDNNIFNGLPDVTIKASNQPLSEVLTQLEKQTPLRFKQSGNLIGVSRIQEAKKNDQPQEQALLDEPLQKKESQFSRNISGTVRDTTGEPLTGITVQLKGGSATITDKNGHFALNNVPDNGIIIVSSIGFITQQINLNSNPSNNLSIVLHSSSSNLAAVSIVSTGYQDIPKERETGSFDIISNAMINRSTSTNILDRISGISSGVIFNGNADKTVNTSGYLARNVGINIRGQSTINASVSPLIVVDNFPYDGEVSNINPNDVESITILKDAAAASIWGANSANGVIVITTKKGRLNQPTQVEFNSSVTIGNKPNVKYDRNFLNSPDYIGVETYLFNQGFFNSDISNTTSYPVVSPAVAILAQQRAGTITQAQATNELNALGQNDVRNDFEKYVYQKSVNQQYSIGIRGGGKDVTYTLSVGTDADKSNLGRNGFSRTTVSSQNTYTPVRNLELTAGLNYNQSNTLLNNQDDWGNSNYSSGNSKYTAIVPYAQLADANGNALPIMKGLNSSYLASAQSKGFFDWTYRPLDEINNADNTTQVSDLLLRVSAKYKIIPALSAGVQYENEHQVVDTRNDQNMATYFTRNLVNQYSVYNSATGAFNYVFPVGSVLNLGNYDWQSNNLRAQLNFNQSFGKNNIVAIGGAEIRQRETNGFMATTNGYSDQFGTGVGSLNYNTSYPTNPSGSKTIPAPSSGELQSLNRYISYYVNGAYSYDDRYTISLSGRKDGANIFGAKTNDKIVPLWSAGLGWNISKESFYDFTSLPYLKLRTSYGFNGNVYQGSAYLKGSYITADITNAKDVQVTSAPNSELTWERVKNINIGIDFATKNNRLSGTIELYQKAGEDLLEATPISAQTGFSSYLGNSAATRTNGIDLTFQSRNLTGNLSWNTTLLTSFIHDKLVTYEVVPTSSSIQVNNGIAGIAGYPLYSIFSYKSAGLDPANGNPRGYLNGKVSEDYASIINNFKPDSLVYNGSARPTVFGALRNDFAFKGFSLSVNIVYELGYVFRKSSVSPNYSDVLAGLANVDFDNRWQQPGDELKTDVPSVVYPSTSARSRFYTYSNTLVESGDNIRLQDIRLGYDIPQSWFRKHPFKRLQLYTYANNIGIIWRKNKDGIDPDNYGWGLTHTLPNPFTISFGINANF